MATQKYTRKTIHALCLMHSLDRLRTENFSCDFMIKVNGQNFPVHRNVLAACSDYFKAMFSHDTKEVQEGAVDIKGTGPEPVKQCIEFIYTGEANITMQTVAEILHASEMIQLNSLTELCFEYLQDNITTENCFMAISLAQTYNNEGAKEVIEKYIVANFDSVVSSEGFAALDKSEISYLILKAAKKDNHEIVWKSITNWVNHDIGERKQHLYKLVKSLDLKNFPFKVVISTIWNDPLVQASNDCKQFLAAYLFSDIENLKSNIDLKICFALKKLAKEFDLQNADVDAAVDDYMMKHFEVAASEHDFDGLCHSDVLHLFQVLRTTHWHQQHIDVLKWNAATKWVKHDPAARKSLFPKLLECIKFEWFSLDFIEKNVRTEPLVKESHECKDLLMDMMCAKVSGSEPSDLFPGETVGISVPPHLHKPTVELVFYIVILDGKNKEIRGLNTKTHVWSSLLSTPQGTSSGFCSIVTLNDELYLFHNRSLYHLQNDLSWLEKPEMVFKHDKSSKVVAFQEEIYVISSSFLAHFDPKLDNWIQYRQPEDFPNGFCVACDKDFIYAMGGYSLSSEARKYDPDMIHWSGISPMIYGRSGASASEMNGFIYVMGGRLPEFIHDTVETYCPATDSWTEVIKMQVPRYNFASCVVEGKRYAVGGHDSIEVYNEEKEEWEFIERIHSRPFGITACSFKCWLVRNRKANGKISETVVLL